MLHTKENTRLHCSNSLISSTRLHCSNSLISSTRLHCSNSLISSTRLHCSNSLISSFHQCSSCPNLQTYRWVYAIYGVDCVGGIEKEVSLCASCLGFDDIVAVQANLLYFKSHWPPAININRKLTPLSSHSYIYVFKFNSSTLSDTTPRI